MDLALTIQGDFAATVLMELPVFVMLTTALSGSGLMFGTVSVTSYKVCTAEALLTSPPHIRAAARSTTLGNRRLMVCTLLGSLLSDRSSAGLSAPRRVRIWCDS